MISKEECGEIAQIEDLALEKIKLGLMSEAADLFREAIQKGSCNFKSRLLLTKILADLQHSQNTLPESKTA